MAALTLALVASLLGLAAAHPVNEVRPGSFKVTQIRNENYDNTTFVPRGPLATYKTYMKFKAPIPEGLNQTVQQYRQAKIARRSTGSAVNTPVNGDEEWITPVSIGTPAQVLNLDFDTGSADLWVFSSITSSSDVDGQTTYKPGQSSTAARLSGATWDISYGDGSSSSGIVYTDVVSVGGVSFSAQAVEAAETVSSEFTSDTDSDGLLGLGASTINTVSPTAQKTFFDNVRASLDSPLFTADLKHNEAGTYNFGEIDSSLYTGAITYTTVSFAEGYWTFDASGYAIGSASATTQTIAGIADTGTTLLYLPIGIVEKYYAQISSAKNSVLEGGYIFLCSATAPDFSFYVGTFKVTIPGEYMNYGAINTAGTYCFGGLQSSASIGINIFGDIALKSAFVIFEHDGTSSPRLGWASKTLS